MLFTSSKQIYLDMQYGTTYDQNGHYYSAPGYLQNGTAYVPVSFACSQFGLNWSFISGDDCNGESQEIVKSIIALARSLGLTVIAEGVEHQDQLDKLRFAECDKAQGFMFSRPVDKDAALLLIRQALDGGCGCSPV